VVIPLAAPTRLGAAEAAAVLAAVDGVLAGPQWVLGPAVAAFEEAFGEYVGAAHVVGVGNGSDALGIAFVALGLEPGDGVLVPPNDAGFAAGAARSVGLVPVVMDVDPRTAGPSVGTATAALRDGVRAVVATHLHGDPLDLSALDAWRRDAGLLLVEDCAQAHGARLAGRHVGSVGDAATYSFYPTKNLGAPGDAGAVVLAEPEHADRARSLREYGWGERYRVDHPRGRNSRLDAVHAATLTARLPFLDARNERRREIAAQLRDALRENDTRLQSDLVDGVVHHAVVVSDRRDDLVAHLAAHGVPTAVHYPWLVGEMPGLGLTAATPVAAGWRDRVLTVPCFPEMTFAEVRAVEQALAAWGAAP
jgi:dTDP-3-amino-2,3,6-trideoxy-4-keto-D-glucose/dTDP-3-amino-3,4,6-trideoxy-alpha-D-glucose/dTDP-2,6-dideoxy-D-kanosamine transaminase